MKENIQNYIAQYIKVFMTKTEKALKQIAKIRHLYDSHSYEKSDLHFLVDCLGTGFDDYYSEIPGIYLKGIKRISALKEFESLLVKDGVLGLFNFFSKFPVPENDFLTIFFIPHYLRYMVPEAWSKNIKLIQYYYNAQMKKKLFLCGSVGLHLQDISSLDKALSVNEYEQIDVLLRIPFKVEGIDFDEALGLNDLLNLLNEIQQKSKVSIKFKKENDYNLSDPKNYDFISVDSDEIISNTNVVEEKLYAAGSSKINLFNCISTRGLEKISLSVNHGFHILEDNFITGEGMKIGKGLYEKMYESGKELHEIEVARLIKKLAHQKISR